MKIENELSSLIQNYFCDRLINQRDASDKTIKSYRDTFRLLFLFCKKHLGKSASDLCLSDINERLVLGFLNYLEKDRKNTVRSRNARFAALRSFFHYVAYQEPAYLPNIQKILAIPMKRFDRPLVGFLLREEINAILAAPDINTWNGQRDQVLFTTLYNTGARVSEIIALKRADVESGQTMVLHLHGKGRKERTIPLWKNTSSLIKKWLKQLDENPVTPLFPNHFGIAMTRSGVENRLKVAVEKAKITCVSLKSKKISPHLIRHTTAMHLLQSGIDITVIALWLGHESITTTHHYMEADVEMKKKALNTIQEPENKTSKKIPSDKLLVFLESL